MAFIRHISKSLLLIAFLALWVVPASAGAPRWIVLAKHVGQSEKTRSAALKELRKIKNLNATLLEALETHDRPLALDVVSALQLQALVPELLKRANADENGFLILTLNSLLNEENKNSILGRYLELLTPENQGTVSAAALVAMLEPLGRLGMALPAKTPEALIEHPFPEVRSAAILYLRISALNYGKREHLPLIQTLMKSSIAQIRLQSVYFLDEISKRAELSEALDWSAVESQCQKESNSHIKARCLETLKNRSQKK